MAATVGVAAGTARLGAAAVIGLVVGSVFSVAAVVFLPPTWIASIYGMNFNKMPELGWDYGYPFSIGLMLLSAFATYFFFKRKGWL